MTRTLLLLLSLAAFAQSPRLDALRLDVAAAKPGAVEAFWAAAKLSTTPLIEPIPGQPRFRRVTYLWRSSDPAANIVLFGGVRGFGDRLHNALKQIPGTDVWFRTETVRSDARFQYMLLLDPPDFNVEAMTRASMKEYEAAEKQMMAAARVDPLNPRQFPAKSTRNVVELPDAPPQPYIAKRIGIPEGTVVRQKLPGKILPGPDREIAIYTPPGFTPDRQEPYPLLVVLDGPTYRSLVPTPTILNNLIAENKIPPLVALFVPNVSAESRMTDLAGSKPFADYLALELLPAFRPRFHYTGDPAKTAIAGSSLGGLTSLFVPYTHPEVFGLVLSQSGSYWWAPGLLPSDGARPEHIDIQPNRMAALMVASPKLPLKIYMDIGLLEIGGAQTLLPSMVDANRHLRDVLLLKGYPVHYREFNGGHEYLNWRGTLSDGLIYLFNPN